VLQVRLYQPSRSSRSRYNARPDPSNQVDQYFNGISTDIPFLHSLARVQNINLCIDLSVRFGGKKNKIHHYTNKQIRRIRDFVGSYPVRDSCTVVLWGGVLAKLSKLKKCGDVLQALKGLVGFRTVRVEVEGFSCDGQLGMKPLSFEEYGLAREALETSLGPCTFWVAPPIGKKPWHHSGLEFHPFDHRRRQLK